jgi:excisionase family DNA binding protein
MASRGRDKRTTGIIDHDFLVALVREQIRQVLPEAMRAVVANGREPNSSSKGNTVQLRVGVLEAARIIGVSRTRLYKHVKEGTIKVTKDGKRTLFSMRELQTFVASTDPNHDTISSHVRRRGTKIE